MAKYSVVLDTDKDSSLISYHNTLEDAKEEAALYVSNPLNKSDYRGRGTVNIYQDGLGAVYHFDFDGHQWESKEV
jgi:hypothetical protein